MSDGPALFAAICAHPDEDTPRLAYADWLDEYAGSLPKDKRESARLRAELIRVQCELAAMPPEEADADTATRRLELEERAVALLIHSARREAWAKPPPGGVVPKVHPSPAVFVRGFPLFASGTVQQFVEQGESLFDVSPVHSLSCWNFDDDISDRFYSQPWLTRVRRLSIAAIDTRPFTTPEFANVEELDFSGWDFGRSKKPPAVRSLTKLRVFSFDVRRWTKPAVFERLSGLLPAEVRLRDFYLAPEL